jgi:hypothetical protein
MKRGKEVEQFLRCTKIDGKKIISWLTIRNQENGYVLLHHKQHDEGSRDYLDIYEFTYLNMPDTRFEPKHLVFATLDEALDYASANLGASNEKWVGHGMVQDEYRDFKYAE